MPNIVFCRETLWDDPLRISTNAIARQFVKNGWRCAWIVTCVHPLRFLRPKVPNRRALWSLVCSGGRWHDQNVFEFCPVSLIRASRHWPLNSPWFTRNLFHWAFPSVSKVLRREGFLPADVLMVGNLAAVSLIDLVPARQVIFHSHDVFCDWLSAQAAYRGIEASLIRRSDLVLAAGDVPLRIISDRYDVPPEKIHIISHASDLSVFAGDHKEPDDLRSIAKPRVAMLGTAATMDRELLMQLASRRQDLQFVRIGPGNLQWKADVASLSLGNVHFLGPKQYEQLPGYLKHCDVGLAMYRVADVGGRIAGGFYMKIFDYAAAGLPIVVTEMPGYEEVKDFMFTARTLGEFSAAVDRALAYTPGQFAKLKRFSREQGSWSARYRQIQELLEGVEENREDR